MHPLASQDLKTLFADQSPISHQKGSLLLEPGEPINHIHLLVKGNVRMYLISPKGEEVTIHIFKPVSLLPIMLIIGNIPNRFYFKATTPVTTSILSTDVVLQFLDKNPHVFFDLTQRLSQAMDGLVTRLESTLFSRSKHKVISLLLYLGRNYGSQRKKTILIDMKLSHEDIASWTGLTRETVSRQISSLKKKKLIYSQNSHLVIEDVDKLSRQLEPN